MITPYLQTEGGKRKKGRKNRKRKRRIVWKERLT
jgi:hypothetical protein